MSLAPFSLGMPLRQGEFPSSAGIACDLPETQVVVKNRWPDGSAKFAIVAGRATIASGNTVVVKVSSGAPSGGTALTEADLKATGVTASITYGAYGVVTLESLIANSPRTRSWISGPQLSSWIYSAPIGSDPHLTAWFEVRLWKGGAIEVLPWIENATLNVPSPGQKSGTATFTLGGSQRYSGALVLEHHTRAVLASGATLSHWLDANPGVVIRHDVSYFQATKLVPTYRAQLPSTSGLLNVLAYTPLAQAGYPTNMGSGGYDASIGLLPEWDVAYLASSADARARVNLIVNAYAAGRYAIHYRDETTGRPFRFTTYPNLVIDGNSSVSSSGASSTGQYTPAPSGSPPTWATSHHPSVGYLAYLITGSAYFLDEIQFSATLGYLKQNDTARQGSKGVFLTNAGANTTRGAAWSLRTLFQAASATADDDPLSGEFLSSIEANIAYYSARRNNPQGICEPYSSYNGDTTPPFAHAAWMEDFLTAAWGYGLDIASGISSTARSTMADFFGWKARAIIGRFGGTSVTEFNYRDAAQYTIAVSPSPPTGVAWNGAGPWYADWGQIYQVTVGRPNDGTIGDLRGAYFPDPTSYWGNLQPALAYAVDQNVPGALEAYRRMVGASNWSQMVDAFNTQPVWSVRPRSA